MKKQSGEVRAAEATLNAGEPADAKRFATALDFAMAVINDEAQPMEAKVRLAIAAMPFQHPKLEGVAPGKKELKQQKAEAAAAGRFAPAAPPKLVIDNG